MFSDEFFLTIGPFTINAHWSALKIFLVTFFGIFQFILNLFLPPFMPLPKIIVIQSLLLHLISLFDSVLLILFLILILQVPAALAGSWPSKDLNCGIIFTFHTVSHNCLASCKIYY